MIGQTISHYNILEKLGEARLHCRFGGQGGPVPPKPNFNIEVFIMIGTAISHYRILEKLGEARLHCRFGGQGGPVPRSAFWEHIPL